MDSAAKNQCRRSCTHFYRSESYLLLVRLSESFGQRETSAGCATGYEYLVARASARARHTPGTGIYRTYLVNTTALYRSFTGRRGRSGK